MFVIGSSMKEIVILKAKLVKEFSMKNMVQWRKFLKWGLTEREKMLLKISQAKYVEKVQKRFNMADAKPVNVPLGGHFKLS